MGLEKPGEKYRALFDSTTVRIWLIDRDDRILRVNTAVASDLGVPREHLFGKNICDLFSPECAVQFSSDNREVMRSGKPKLGIVEEYSLVTGETGWVQADKIPYCDEDGEITGLMIFASDITGHKRAKEALYASQLQLSEAMDLARIVYWEFDPSTEEFVFNDPFYAFYGTTAEEEGGYRMSVTEYAVRFIHPDDRQCYFELVEENPPNEGGFLIDLEHRALLRDGQVRHILARMRGIVDGSGALRLYGANQDITERKLAEEALRESGMRYRSLFDDSPTALIEVDGSAARAYVDRLRASGVEDMGKYADDNPEVIKECLSLLEFTSVNKATLDLYEAPNIEDFRRNSRHSIADAPNSLLRGDFLAIADGMQAEREQVRLTRNGKRIYINSKWTVAPGYEKTLGRILFCDMDITKSREAEEILRTTQLQLSEAMDLASIVYWELDWTTETFVFNDAFYAFLGTTAEREGGYMMAAEEYAKRFIHPDDIGLIRQAVEKIRSERDPEFLIDIEHRIVRRDGEVRYILARERGIRDAAGRITRCYGANQDITKRKQAEEENSRLQSQLLQAQKMEAIGTLAGGVAHDFNNLLTVIMGFANLAQMSLAEDDRVRRYIDQIVTSSNRAADLTQSLLAFSRKQRITLAPRDINNVVRSSAKLLARLLNEDIELRLELTEKAVVAKADVTQMDQVLMNLATNARDAMPNGGSLTIGTEVVTLDETFMRTFGFGKPGSYVLLSITDTGMGMDEKTRERIFDPFFTTKEVGKGTGLGLASVYGIVKQHEGYITVSSDPSWGSSFHIYLPLVSSAETLKGLPAEDVRKGTETVLVAEDNEDVRRLITTVLTGNGYRTLEAVDGEDAVRLFKENREEIDAVILDVVMPRKNGKEAYDEISALSGGAKVIFLSGYSGDIMVDKGIQSNAVDLVSKPLSISKLLSKVREVLDR